VKAQPLDPVALGLKLGQHLGPGAERLPAFLSVLSLLLLFALPMDLSTLVSSLIGV